MTFGKTLKPLLGASLEDRAARAVDWSASPHAARFKEAIDDDFNTPLAMAVLFELAADVNRGDAAAATLLKSLGGVLGLLDRDPTAFLQGAPTTGSPVLASLNASLPTLSLSIDANVGLAPPQIQSRIAERAISKQAKDFKRADAIRAELLSQGVVLEDKPGGLTEWRRA